MFITYFWEFDPGSVGLMGNRQVSSQGWQLVSYTMLHLYNVWQQRGHVMIHFCPYPNQSWSAVFIFVTNVCDCSCNKDPTCAMVKEFEGGQQAWSDHYLFYPNCFTQSHNGMPFENASGCEGRSNAIISSSTVLLTDPWKVCRLNDLWEICRLIKIFSIDGVTTAFSR